MHCVAKKYKYKNLLHLIAKKIEKAYSIGMVERSGYLHKLETLREKQLIKVITGVRRCGKSVLMQQFRARLQKEGVAQSQIHFVNMDDLAYRELFRYDKLYDYLNARILPDKMNYIFIDEVQKVEEFQKAVESLYLKQNVDIYLTGSNAELLSGDLATLLSGRYVEIKMLPLSFAEYVTFRSQTENENLPAKQELFADYIRFGAFPYVVQLEKNEENIRDYLTGIYNTVLLNDIIKAYSVSDVAALERMVRFLFSNTGNMCSVKKIADTLTSSGCKISPHTVDSYLEALHKTYIIYEAGRFDIKGRRFLHTLEKQYAVDTGLRNSQIGGTATDYGSLLENVVYLELLRRGLPVYVGKSGEREIDFVTMEGTDRTYYQVAATVMDKAVYDREYTPLRTTGDSYRKCVLTMDTLPNTVDDGIVQKNIIDWLLHEEARR